MKYFVPAVFLTVLILTACCKPAEPQMTIQINDAQGNDLLVGETATDSNWALLETPVDWGGEPLEIVSVNGGNGLMIGGWEIESGQDQYLRINSNDVDTFNIIYDTKGRCNLKIRIDQITYNGNVFEGNDESNVVITKY